jgi:hypothetical protein
MIKRICEYCNIEYKPKSYRSKKRKFCSYNCYHLSRIGVKRPNQSKNLLGSKNPNWRGGKRKDKSGYILVYVPDHPYCDGDYLVREHRLVMEKHLGRYLKPEEIVHHINQIKSDNRIENLKLFSNNSEHSRYPHKNKGRK